MAQKNGRRGGGAVTIHEVARQAGVSAMTVSRIVNREDNVREETRARVNDVIKALNYLPNLAARSLAGADMVRIGVLYSDSTSAFLSALLVGCVEKSTVLGCQLTLEQCNDLESENRAIERLVLGGADGIVLPPPLCDSADALKAVADSGIPAVLVTSGRPPVGFSAVSIDEFEASREMTRHLVSLGHSRIAFIRGHPDHAASAERFKGYLEGMKDAGLGVTSSQVAQGFFSYRSGIDAAQHLLSNGWGPTAVFACNDDMAAATIGVAHRRGMEVPKDLAVVGFDDTPLATMTWPTLTTVRRPISEMAREAVRMLVEKIRGMRIGSPLPNEHTILTYALIERESSRPPKHRR